MSYVTLYRKWRPNEFGEVKGQEHIVTTLMNQIKHDRIGHAYLFCGTRGTGKTTIAKLFAKAVNCEHPLEDGSPCNECETCKSINAGNYINVKEIDAASNNGVDSIRDIRDEVQYSPTDGKYRVYIIDEVHMLSIGAFNALLKTLEEPPSYVIFILATTESHKIPITIVSRCQKYDFKRISLETIADRLKELMDREGLEVEDKAIRYIAKAADGSMRDGLSLLEQCISFHFGEILTYDRVIEVLGIVDIEVLTRLLTSIIDRDTMKAIEVIDDIVWQGRELGQFITDFTWYMRNVLLVKASSDDVENLDMSEENIKVVTDISNTVDMESLMRYIRVFSELSNNIKYATSKRVLLEMAVIKLCIPEMDNNYDALSDRIKALEQDVESKLEEMSHIKPVVTYAQEKQAEPEVVLPKAGGEEVAKLISKPSDMVSFLESMDDITAKSIAAVLKKGIAGENTSYMKAEGEQGEVLGIYLDSMLFANDEKNKEHTQTIVKALSNRYKLIYRLRITQANKKVDTNIIPAGMDNVEYKN